MTNELKHGSVGSELTQTKWEAIGAHVFESQSTGDILYASSATQLSRLAIGSSGNVLATKSGIPAWIGGGSSSPTSYTAGTPLVAIYATSSNTTSTNAEPFYLKSVMTGVGGYGGRATFHAYTNVALTTNFMGLKSYAEFGSSGAISGLAAGFCAEMKTPNANLGGGNFYPLELEYVAGGASTASAANAGRVGWMYMNNTGDADGDFDDNGVLFDVEGLTAGNTHLYSTGASTATGDATLKIKVNGVIKYLLVADDAS
jgi:hypothetical protein